jgi:FPC/CPF motif-containing protein YcgG
MTGWQDIDVRAALAAKIGGDEFSCVGGKSAWLRGTVVHRHFGRMAAEETTGPLYAALAGFAAERDAIDPLLATFVATFAGAGDDGAGDERAGEAAFEELTWRQLQRLHDLDVLHHDWDPAVDADPASPRFGFSVGGHAFFVVGLHPAASRISRRFPHPALVFNSHLQFRRLRERGVYHRIQQQVRQRELALQGSLNPNLADFGEASEARQYSGRAVPDDWRCPFRPRVPATGGPR